MPVPVPQVQGSPHWQVPGSHTPNVNAPLGQFEWSPSFSGGRRMPVPVPQVQGSHTPNVHAAPPGGTSSPPQGPHVTNPGQTVDANRPPSEPAHNRGRVAHKNPAHVTNPDQTVDADRPPSEPAHDHRQVAHKNPAHLTNSGFLKDYCILPIGTKYSTPSHPDRLIELKAMPKNRAISVKRVATIGALLHVKVLLPIGTRFTMSIDPNYVRVPTEVTGIRIIEQEDQDKSWSFAERRIEITLLSLECKMRCRNGMSAGVSISTCGMSKVVNSKRCLLSPEIYMALPYHNV
ncbi:hypothetical protein APHAL10511_000681 [Amanita phalloides]|nr:hypothetical protein APHAL10511_000681 [Amanita phalloides]